MPTTCPKCGQDLPEVEILKYRYCPHCGAEITAAPSEDYRSLVRAKVIEESVIRATSSVPTFEATAPTACLVTVQPLHVIIEHVIIEHLSHVPAQLVCRMRAAAIGERRPCREGKGNERKESRHRRWTNPLIRPTPTAGSIRTLLLLHTCADVHASWVYLASYVVC